MISMPAGRVLGCLIEKQLSTPQHYPLTMNALKLACNQTTNREPVTNLDESDVQRALDELKGGRLVRFVLPSHGKSVTRYRHVLDEVLPLGSPQIALLGVLLLRGSQTAGELRVRTARMADFDSVSAVQDELEALARQPEPLVQLLRRRPGQKEDRWRQLLAEDGEGSTSEPGRAPAPVTASDAPEEPTLPVAASGDPIRGTEEHASLERRIDELQAEVADLRERVTGLTASLIALQEDVGR
jgi:uncharacterized protein